ncbi:MAG: DEAD/DEAH box helicase [Planctomycetes bacterium]|nr:DEAD/DEAH box helicase [Planctomycetota bacterium]
MAPTHFARRISAYPIDSRVEGAGMYRGGAVEIRSLTENDAVATVVAHGIDYRVDVVGAESTNRSRCRCTCSPMMLDARCAHVVATLMAIDEVLHDLDAAVAAFELEAGMPEPQRPAAQPTRSPAWRERLARIGTGHPPGSRTTSWIEYYVRPGDAYGTAALTLQIRERQRRQDGEVTAPRASRLSPATVAALPREDRLLLAAMRHSQMRGRDAWFRRSDEVSLARPWDVDAAEAPLVLPLLAARDMVFVGPAPVGAAQPRRLRIDVAAPFVFTLVPVPCEGDRACVDVIGVFRRGDEALGPDVVSDVGSPYVLVEDRLVRAERNGAEPLHREFVENGPMRVSMAELPEMLATCARSGEAKDLLAAAIEHVPAGAPEGVVTVSIPTNTSAPLRAGLCFDYAGTLVFDNDASPLVDGDEGPRRRDRDAEQRLRERMVEFGLSTAPDGVFECPRDRMPGAVAALAKAGFRVLAEGRRVRPFVEGNASVRSGIDWFAIDGLVEFADRAVSLPELLRGKVTPEGFVELGDGSLGMLPAAWLRSVERMRLVAGDVDGDSLRVPTSRALLLDALLSADDTKQFEVDANFARMRQRIGRFTTIEPANEPRGFAGTLRPYQKAGVGWLRFLVEFGLGGCLADDMGLGKTVQVLALLAESAPRGSRRKGRRPSLLVAPRSVLGNWLDEAKRFAPGLRVLDFAGPQRWTEYGDRLGEFDLVLTTYGIVRADAPEFVERGIDFEHAILDEAQAIKNPDSQAAKAVRLLRARHRLVMTGTPVENHLGDLWSLFEFVNPGMLGRLPAFRALFAKATSSDAMAANRELVQRALRPVMLRRTKAQVLVDLPEKIEQTVWCELGPAQRKRYDALRRHYQRKLLAGGGELGNEQRFLVLEALLRLRQAACHEGLLVRSGRTAESAKFEELLARLDELGVEGHKVLVFSQFTTLLDLLEPQLRVRGIVWERLDGSTTKRGERVARFQNDPDCRVFLISLKAGGYGLNLTAASYVFLLDPWWNPAVEMQAIDRAHRIGQKRVVNAYRLVCRGTVEERVLELQAKKKELCEAILGNERSLLQDLTRADLELLLG